MPGLEAVGDGVLAQAVQKGCRVFSLEMFKSHLDICALGIPAEAQVWPYETIGLCQCQPFCDSVTVRKY